MISSYRHVLQREQLENSCAAENLPVFHWRYGWDADSKRKAKARLWRKYCVMEHNRQNNLWKKNYYILWAGQAISVLTSSILQMALIWYRDALKAKVEEL